MRPRLHFPLRATLRDYGSADLRADVIAGLSVAVVLIPQGMGYAMLAGLPPIAGLYAALLPPIVYALLGTSRQLAVGPVALDSLLVAVSVSAVAQSGSDDYLTAAVSLAAMVGCVQLVLGLMGMGALANLLSRPVLSGFTSAAALIIGFSQLEHLLAVPLPHTHHVHRIAIEALRQSSAWHLPTLALGTCLLLLLVTLKRFVPAWPRAMLAAALGSLAVWALDLLDSGLRAVGTVPAGLPVPALPVLDLAMLAALWPAALTIGMVAFVEAVSIGTRLSRQYGGEIDPSQELVAIGSANLASSLVGGYPVTGSFSRSAVGAQAGVRSPLGGAVAGLAVAATLLLLTPVFAFVPLSALSAIIITTVWGLFEPAQARKLWRIKRSDFWTLVFTFAMTLAAGIQYGILAGVALSLAGFVVRTTRPHVAVLGRIPGTEAYLSILRHPHVQQQPGLLIVRVDAQFYFGNVSFLRETLRELEHNHGAVLRVVVLEASGINQLDSSAAEALQEIDLAYRERDVQLLLSHVKGPVRDVLYATGMLQRLSQEQRIFLRTHEAVVRACASMGVELPSSASVDRGEDLRAPMDRIGCSVAPAATDGDDGSGDQDQGQASPSSSSS